MGPEQWWAPVVMLTTKVSEYTLAGLPKLTVRLVALASLVLQDLGLRTERSSNYVPVSKRGQKKKKKEPGGGEESSF